MLLYLILILLGLVFGSFLSAITYRIPREIDFVKGRSMCPKCNKTIAWYDNIPLISYLILRGKCRNCKTKISIRYPLIEFSTVIIFVALFAAQIQGQSLQDVVLAYVYSIIIALILEAIFIIDFEQQIIPDSLVFAGIVVYILHFIITGSSLLFPNLIAGFLSSILLLILHLITKGRGMGLGDVKFAVLGGLLVGINLFYIWLMLAFLTGASLGIILILGKKAGLKSQIAFGPFLIIAIPLTLLYGEKICHWLYFN